MAIQYRDRREELLKFLKTRKRPEAHLLASFLKHAMDRGEAGQLKLCDSLEQFRDLASYGISFLNQE